MSARRVVVVATLLLLAAARGAAAGDSVTRIEPPPPLPDKPWSTVRGEQISFLERLKLWGVTIEAGPKGETAIKDTPDLFKMETKWESPDEVSLKLGIKVPEVLKRYAFEGEYKLTIAPNATKNDMSGGLEFDGSKVSGELKSASDEGVGYEIAGEFKRSLLKLKAATGSKGGTYEIGLELGAVTVKLDPVKYFERFVEFVPRFGAFAAGPAGEAANAVALTLNPGLAAAALANDVTLFLAQLRAEKAALDAARRQMLAEFAAGLREEQAALRLQAEGARRAADYVDAVERLYASRSPDLRARYGAYQRLAANPTRPLALPPPAARYAGSDVDSDSESSASSSSGRNWERDTTPREPPSRSFEFHSPTFNFLKGGGSF